MDRLKRPRTKAFLSCLAIGTAFILIYTFTSSLVIDSGYAVKAGQAYQPAGNQELTTENQELTISRAAAEGTGSDLSATSRGDEYRTPLAKPAAAPAKPAAPVKAAAKPAPVPAATPKAAPAKPSSYEYNLDLLARLITAEAQGEPYEAQVAVGAVVMNRVKSSDWPNTLKGVIYQEIGGYYQFTPVINGWIDKPAQPECIKAAKAAMSGADPTHGAQFYYDDKVTNQWILAKPVSVKFGHMVFAF